MSDQTTAPARCTKAKPGTLYSTSWPADVLVEYGPASTDERAVGERKTYDVFVDGTLVGTVSGAREESSRPTHRGSRIRTITGYPMRWRYSMRAAAAPDAPTRLRSASYSRTTRVEATAAMVGAYLQHRPRP